MKTKTFSIEKQRFIDVPPHVLFEALTNPEKIVQYYPLQEIISNWHIGDEIILKGNHNGQRFIDYGIITDLIPNQRFEYTYWSDNHGTERIAENELTICYTLEPTDSGTTLNVRHTNLKSEQMYLEMLKVWEFLLSNLKTFVENMGK